MPDFGIFRGFNSKLFSDKLYAGQLPTQLGKIGSENILPLLLDLYPNAAAAYSLRKLRDAYTGSAIRVRRSSDNDEQNIGFTGTGDLDTSSLTSFCGSGNGFVTTWYDQSGNARNATQSTAANQPQIVSSGSLLTLNSKPKIDATSLQFLKFNSDIATSNSNYSLFMTYYKDTTGNQGIVLKDGSNYHWLDYGTTQYISTADAISISTTFQINTQYLYSCITNYSVGASIYRNNNLLGTRSALTSNSISSYLPSNVFRTAKISLQEFIYYPSNQSSNRTGIQSNINTYYGIY
jgi:hypothetical protein